MHLLRPQIARGIATCVRGDLRGRKPHNRRSKRRKLKYTGRHRQGSSTDPSQIGGGVVFAPKPRSYRYSIPRKIRKLAMKSILSSKLADNEMIVLDELNFDAPKTKEMVKVLENIKADKKALIVTAERNENLIKSAANIPGVRIAMVSTMNVYEIINHTNFVVTKDAINKIEEVYAQ